MAKRKKKGYLLGVDKLPSRMRKGGHIRKFSPKFNGEIRVIMPFKSKKRKKI